MRKESTQIAAIDFGTSKIVAMVACPGSMNRLEILGSGTVPYDGYSEGTWNTPQQMDRRLRDAIAAAQTEAGTQITEAYIGVPGEYIHVLNRTVEIDVPEGVIGDDTLNMLYDKAADDLELESYGCRVIHRSAAWFSMDGKRPTMKPEGSCQRLEGEVSFILADQDFIEDATDLMNRQNIAILGFLSSSLGQGLLLLSLQEQDSTSVMVDCGYLNTEVNVFHGDAIVYHAMLPQGGGHITADLAMSLGINMRTAEYVKRNYVFNPDSFDRNSYVEATDERGGLLTFDRSEVQAVVERTVGELADMLRLTFDNDIEPMLTRQSSIVLTGGGITLMRGGREYLSSLVGRNFKVVPSKATKMGSPVFSSVQGLADLVMNQIEDQQEAQQSGFGKFKNMFGKKR